jgi:hypothetical protein
VAFVSEIKVMWLAGVFQRGSIINKKHGVVNGVFSRSSAKNA